MPHVQRTMTTSIPDVGQNIFGAGPTASLGEEHSADPVSAASLVPASGDFQDWRFPTMNPENGAAFVNVPNLPGPGEIYYEAGTFDDFMPGGGSVMEPWEMDFTNEMMVDGAQANKFEAWAS